MLIQYGLRLIVEHSLNIKISCRLNRNKGDVKWSLLVSGGGLFNTLRAGEADLRF